MNRRGFLSLLTAGLTGLKLWNPDPLSPNPVGRVVPIDLPPRYVPPANSLVIGQSVSVRLPQRFITNWIDHENGKPIKSFREYLPVNHPSLFLG